MPCNPNQVSIDLPDGPSGVAIPGFGVPFSLKLPNINPFPEGFPEDLLDLLNQLQMLIPPGALLPQLNPNFGKDIFDAIMKLLDQFMPYLMMYKFFLPLLKLLLCVIEVLCALKNPFKTLRAVKRLFRRCIPDFLNLFPLWALIIMIISLLLLLIALIKYIIEQIIKFIQRILRNILALANAFRDANDNAILAIAQKLGALLCIFQNLFVLLALFNIIFGVIRDILSLAFAVPPCGEGSTESVGKTDNCCDAEVCPEIVKNDYKRETGTLQYYSKINQTFSILPSFSNEYRAESIQFFDVYQEQNQRFSNIYDAYDITETPKPVFFPTDSTYTSATPPKQASYTFDLRMFYNPETYGRTNISDGEPRWIKFEDCIMLQVPSSNFKYYDNSNQIIPTGVCYIGGGLGYEDDGSILYGYEEDGHTKSSTQATLNNFLHMQDINTDIPNPSQDDGYTFYENVEYIFKPNHEVLWSKDLITAGCIPDVSLDRTFVNDAIAGDFALSLSLLGEAMKPENGFPDIEGAQECLTTAISGFRGNLTVEGVAQFQTTALACMSKLNDEANAALGNIVELGFDACSSDFEISHTKQFTTQPIVITATLRERNGYGIASSLTSDIGYNLSKKMKAHATFGDVTNFSYDGYSSFTANISSEEPGSGQLMVSFDDQIFCTNNLPDDVDEDPSRTLNTLDYRFVYAPTSPFSPAVPTTDGDSTTKPRRDAGDQATAGHNAGGKDGS